MDRQNIKELRKIAKERKIKDYYDMRKSELLQAINLKPNPKPVLELPIPEIRQNLQNSRLNLNPILDEPIPEINGQIFRTEINNWKN